MKSVSTRLSPVFAQGTSGQVAERVLGWTRDTKAPACHQAPWAAGAPSGPPKRYKPFQPAVRAAYSHGAALHRPLGLGRPRDAPRQSAGPAQGAPAAASSPRFDLWPAGPQQREGRSRSPGGRDAHAPTPRTAPVCGREAPRQRSRLPPARLPESAGRRCPGRAERRRRPVPG